MIFAAKAADRSGLIHSAWPKLVNVSAGTCVKDAVEIEAETRDANVPAQSHRAVVSAMGVGHGKGQPWFFSYLTGKCRIDGTEDDPVISQGGGNFELRLALFPSPRLTDRSHKILTLATTITLPITPPSNPQPKKTQSIFGFVPLTLSATDL